jgi:hypothetical protein
VSIVKENPSTQAAGLVAQITGTYNTGSMVGDIRRAWLADTQAGTVSDASLVNNGNFATATDWTGQNNGVVSIAGGQMTVTNNGAFFGRAFNSLQFQVVAGQAIEYSVTVPAGSANPCFINLADASTGAAMSTLPSSMAPGGTYKGFLVANTSGTAVLRLENQSSVNGASFTVSAISGKQATADRSVKAKPVSTFGTLAKTIVATAAQMVAYASFSATNYLQEAYSADLDLGTGAWTASGWMNVPSTGFGPANFIRNSAFAGDTVNDTSGGGNTTNGVTTSILGYGTESGMRYFDIRISGTPTATSAAILAWSGSTSRPSAALGQTFAGQVCVTLQAGSMTNVSQLVAEVAEYDSGGTPVAASGTTLTPAAGSLPANRYTFSRTCNAASVSTVALRGFRLNYTSGQAIDITLRIGAPQLERGATANAFIASPATAQFIGIAPIIHRGAATGAYWMLGIDGNGMLAAEVYDGTTTRRVTSTAAYNTGAWVKARVQYDGAGALTLKANGEQVAQATGAALLTLNNASAVATVGNNQALTAAFPGSLAMVKVGATVPFTEQSQWAYSQERAMFMDGAQVTLPDTGNVVDMAYDDMQGRLKVATAANECSFSGLVRVQSAAVPAGSYSKATLRSGVKLLARTTTNPGVDVSIASKNLIEDLLRRGEEAARLARLPEMYAVDATASQTDFVLPAGAETRKVWLAGSLKREGASKDYTVLFDGFKETVRANAGQSSGTSVQIEWRKAA